MNALLLAAMLIAQTEWRSVPASNQLALFVNGTQHGVLMENGDYMVYRCYGGYCKWEKETPPVAPPAKAEARPQLDLGLLSSRIEKLEAENGVLRAWVQDHVETRFTRRLEEEAEAIKNYDPDKKQVGFSILLGPFVTLIGMVVKAIIQAMIIAAIVALLIKYKWWAIGYVVAHVLLAYVAGKVGGKSVGTR